MDVDGTFPASSCSVNWSNVEGRVLLSSPSSKTALSMILSLGASARYSLSVKCPRPAMHENSQHTLQRPSSGIRFL